MRVLSFEVSFDAFVHEPEAGLHAKDGFPHYPEAEVAWFDEAGVDGADRDLINAGPLDGDKGIRPPVGGERRRGPGVVAHRMPALGPVLVQDEAPRLGVTDGHDAEEVGELTLETAGWKGQRGQGGHLGPGPLERHMEFDAAVGWSRGKEIDGTHLRAVVVTRDQGEAHPLREERLGDAD